MRGRNLLFLYMQRVRTHPLQELLALLGVSVGVALVFAVQVANTSIVGSVEQFVRGVTGSADLQITARDVHGFDAGLADRVARLPGVRATAPLVEARANLRSRAQTRTVSLIGGDQRILQLGGRMLRDVTSRHFRLTGAIAMPQPLADSLRVSVDEMVRLAVGAQSHPVAVATVLTRDEVGSLVDSPLVLAPLDYAQRISGLRGRVTRILVAVRRGQLATVRRELRRLVGNRLNVSAGDAEVHLLREASAPNDQSTALFAGISALVGFLFAYNAMLLTIPERRRFLADLRLEGLGDLTVLRLVLFDALVLGLGACALGLALGDALSRHAFRSVPGYLAFAFAIGDQRVVDTTSVIFACAGGIAATVLAAVHPLKDLFSRRPLDDLYHEDEERGTGRIVPRRWLAASGAGLVMAASVVLLTAPRSTLIGIVLLLCGMLSLIPAILVVALRLVDKVSERVRSVVLVVSVGELRTTTTRSLALGATGALALFGSVAVEGAHFDLQRGLDQGAHQINAKADLWISPGGEGNVLATTPFKPSSAAPATLAALPEVRSVRAYRGAFLDFDGRRAWVIANPRADSHPLSERTILAGDVAAANRRLRERGWVALSASIAHDVGAKIGDAVSLPTPRPIRLRLAATLTNLGWASGAVVMNAEDYRRAWASDDVSALQLLLDPNVSAQAVQQTVRHLLGPTTNLSVETAAQREERFRTKTRQGLNRLTQIASLVLVAAALALATAMGGVIWSRRPRLITLKLTGFTDGEVWRALVLESAIVLGIGCSVGALFGLYGQFMLTRWLSDSTGFPTSYQPAITLACATFAAVTLVAVAISAVPGYAAARVPANPGASED